MIVKQVVELAPVDLVHRDGHCEVPLVLLEVGDPSVEEVVDRRLLQPLHSVGFPRAGLSVGENGNDALVKNEVQNRLDRILVQVVVGLQMGEGVVEDEF